MSAADAILAVLERQAAELRTMRKGLDKLRAEMKATATAAQSVPHAVKRAVAAKLMGVGGTKLDALIKAGKVKTADDVTLVPMAEVKRYCAPKVARVRRPSVGHRARNRHVDGQSDEAIDEARRAMRGAR